MHQLMLRGFSSALATAAILLTGFAIVATAGVCPAEPPAGGGCAGTCMIKGDSCTPTTITGGGITRDACSCLPQR